MSSSVTGLQRVPTLGNGPCIYCADCMLIFCSRRHLILLQKVIRTNKVSAPFRRRKTNNAYIPLEERTFHLPRDWRRGCLLLNAISVLISHFCGEDSPRNRLLSYFDLLALQC